MHHHPVAAAVADGRDDEDDEATEEGKWQEEEPGGLDDAVFAYGDGGGLVDGAEHCDHVAADADIIAEANAAEHADEVVSDGGVVVGPDVAKEVDHVVLCGASDVDVAEEDDDVAGDVGVGIDVDAAEEADGIMDRVGGGGRNRFAKLDGVRIGRAEAGKAASAARARVWTEIFLIMFGGSKNRIRRGEGKSSVREGEAGK